MFIYLIIFFVITIIIIAKRICLFRFVTKSARSQRALLQ